LYNLLTDWEEGFVRHCIAVFAFVSMGGLISAAPDELQDSYTKLQAAVAKKSPDEVKTGAAETSKLARALVNAPKPSDASEVEDWTKRVEYGKEVDGYTEYALGFTAAQVDGAKTIELTEVLLAQNSKSKYVDLCAPAYIAAAAKSGGAAKQMDAAQKIITGRPDNEAALYTLAEGLASKSPDRALVYANKLVTVMKGKAKPEGISEADWERQKSMYLASGYYNSGFLYGTKQSWPDCDRNLKAALPMISSDPTRLGNAYFMLGVCNFQFGKLTNDRTKMQAGEQYSEKSAAIKGPMQAQAYANVNVMKQALGGR
jgi:hypothetical protein